MEERENKIETENAGIDTNMREIEEKTLSEIELKKDGVHQKAIEYLKITKNICYECGKKISGLGIFECSYCHKYFDIEHHLPEKHHCNGKPPAPEKRIRICYNYKRYYLYRNL